MNNDSNAGGSIAGFIYQVYYFLYRLLTMQRGETVSLEKIDDVGTETENEEARTYYQLKHTINSKPSAIKRMSDRDTDLWKTLSMWVTIIKKQGDENAQRIWIEQSEFVIISNKATDTNQFFQLLGEYQQNEEKWEDLKKYMAEQAAVEPKEKETEKEEKEKEDKKTIYYYTKNVNEFALLKEFLLKVEPELKSDNEIKADIDYYLVNKWNFKEPNAIVLRERLYGRISGLITDKVLEFNLESFHEKFGELFTKVKERKFVPSNKTFLIPENPREQVFIKQLVDINDVMAQTVDDIKELTQQKLQFENDYNDALSVSDGDDRVIFENDVKTRWKKHYRKHNNGIDDTTKKEDADVAARLVLDGVRSEHLIFDQDILNESNSNGCYYHFSDGKTPKIGWRYDWKEKYNGEEWTIE